MPTKPLERPLPGPQQLGLFDDAQAITSERTDADVRLRQVRTAENAIAYVLRRSRRKTIGFQIDERGLTVTAPQWVGLGQIEAAIVEKQRWIVQKIAEFRSRRSAVRTVEWAHGGTLPYLGRTLKIVLDGRQPRASCHWDDPLSQLHVPLGADATGQQIKDRVQSWLQSQARAIFESRLLHFGARLGVLHRELRLSSAATRWGSCSADGRIMLNWRLVHFPMSSIDYVVAHELSHLKEMNHGPKFWATVGTILPDFEQARAQLKNPPVDLLPTL